MNELVKGVWVGVVTNLMVAAILNTFLKPSTAAWLVTLAAANEVLGVLLVASPELIGLAQDLGTRAKRLYYKRLQPILSHFYRSRTHRVSASLTMPFEIGVKVVGEAAPPANASEKERIDFLFRRIKELDARMDALDERLRAGDEGLRAEMKQMRSDLTDKTAQDMRDLAERNLSLRLLGVLCVLIGIVLALAGNLVAL